ncbi:MAG: hypothetical protein FJX30_04360 [Alphaproteobacteria bacterium]|nr:hypothetical protein [Alphaproteobacteria bacterium]
MPLFRITKNLFLTIFIFFVSCSVNAQNVSNSVESENLIPVESKKNTIKNQIQQKKSFRKKSQKFSQKKSKKTLSKKSKKTIGKKIVKRVYPNKNDTQKLEDVSKNESEKSLNVDEDLKNLKNNNGQNYQEVAGNYLIEAELKDNCDRLTGSECFRGDSFFQEPYFHYTLLTIFNHKVIAEQYFEGAKKDKVFLKVQDGEFLLYSKNNNKIFVVIKNGLVNELMVLKGDLNNEVKIENKCQYVDKLYAYHALYKTNEIDEKNFLYSDKANFKGLIEGKIFVEKYQPKVFYTIFKTPNKEYRPIQNLNLCKMGEDIEAIERDFTKKQCNKKIKCTMQILENYGSEGFSVKDQNYLFSEYYSADKNLNLNTLQINGLIDETNKLGTEDKKNLKSRCFNDKNIDLISCSKSEKCNDYLEVERCEVNYYFDSSKIGFNK